MEAIVDVLSEMLESNAMIVTGSSGLAVEIFHVRFVIETGSEFSSQLRSVPWVTAYLR